MLTGKKCKKTKDFRCTFSFGKKACITSRNNLRYSHQTNHKERRETDDTERGRERELGFFCIQFSLVNQASRKIPNRKESNRIPKKKQNKLR